MKMIIEIVIMITIPNNDNDKKNHDDTPQRKRKTGKKYQDFAKKYTMYYLGFELQRQNC